jgi:kynurenine formamidase
VRAADGPRVAPFGFTRIVFLSHVITAGGPTFPGDPLVEIRPAATIERDGYHLQSLVAGEQAGTHWAAPAHFAAGQAAADELDPGDFFYPAVVLDVRAEAKEDPDFTSASRRSGAGRRNSGRSRRTAPSSCGRASRTGGTTRRPT